jgi:hypothetical protein
MVEGLNPLLVRDTCQERVPNMHVKDVVKVEKA